MLYALTDDDVHINNEVKKSKSVAILKQTRYYKNTEKGAREMCVIWWRNKRTTIIILP